MIALRSTGQTFNALSNMVVPTKMTIATLVAEARNVRLLPLQLLERGRRIKRTQEATLGLAQKADEVDRQMEADAELLANRRPFATPGRTRENVQNMRKENATTLMMKKIGQVQKVEVGVEALDPIDRRAVPEKVERKEEEKAKQRARETLPLLPRIEALSRVTFSYDYVVRHRL